MSILFFTSEYKTLSEAIEWLSHTLKVAKENIEPCARSNWSAFHANLITEPPVKNMSVLMPLLHEEIATHAMVRHTIDIIIKVIQKVNPDQVPVITGDQPVYAIAKQVQWLYPNQYGEDKILMMMGPLHIEMATINMIGDWLQSSGWVNIIIKSEMHTPGRADSLLSGKHPKRSRYAHQVSCSVLFILMQDAYEQSDKSHNFEDWISKRLQSHPIFYIG